MSAQKGYTYITLVFVFFLIFLTLFLIPRKIPKPVERPACSLGNAPAYNPPVVIQEPPIHDRDGENSDLAEYSYIQGGPELGKPLVGYRLVRENVPVKGDVLFNADPVAIPHHIDYLKSVPNPKPGGDSQEYNIVYPGKYGEITMQKDFDPAPFYSDTRNAPGKNQYRFRQEGYIYLVKSKNGERIVNMIDNLPIYTVDFYQQEEIYNDKSRTYDDNGAIWECGNGNSPDEKVRPVEKNTVYLPVQSPSTTKEQLQLEWFLFKSQTYVDVHCKPAIYLYPKEKTLVSVKVNTKGFLTYVDPPYPAGGWNVTAYPSGKIDAANNNLYDFLYYESKVPDGLIHKPEQGWVVKYDQLESLYQEILPKLGLNETQTEDFTAYWTKALKNDSPYYFVGVMDQNSINYLEPLQITPKPDTLNRVRLYFQRLDQYKSVEPPVLKSPNMSGFKVVEWGGMVKNDLTHPFTCSQ